MSEFERGGDPGETHVLPLRFDAHGLFCRKHLTGEEVNDGSGDRAIGNIIIPQKSANKTLIVEVRAIGPMVGKICSRDHAFYFHRGEDEKMRPRILTDHYRVGDKLLCPSGHFVHIKNGQFNDCEYYIEESLPLAKYVIEDGEEIMKPIGGRVLIEPVEEDEFDGSILLPERYRNKRQGVVIAVGTGKKDVDGVDIPFYVKPGDTVIFPKTGGWTETEQDGVTRYIMTEGDLLGVVV